jgi:hypothetical protein
VAWFENNYLCPECGAVWDSEWSCACNDECPDCETGDITPVFSREMTISVEPVGDGVWMIWQSPENADDDPDYQVVGTLVSMKSGKLRFVRPAAAR